MRASAGLPVALAQVAVLVAASAGAENALPTRMGESGFLDVPVAESLGRGGSAFSLDLRYVQADDMRRSVVPSPLVMSFGFGRGEAGFSLREGGLPGDARPYSTTPAVSGKLSVLDAKGKRPALALDLLLDRINHAPVTHLRAVATSQRRWRTRATAFAGGVLGIDRPSGWTAGAALSIAGPRQTELLMEGLRQPGGLLAGVGVRWLPWPQIALGIGASYLPDDANGFFAGLNLAFLHPAPAVPERASATGVEEESEARPGTGKKIFASERPRFALELRQRPLPGTEGGPAPHYPGNAVAAGAEAVPPEKPAAAETAPLSEQAAPEVEVVASGPPAEAPTTLPVMRGNRLVQRRVIDSVIITMRRARSLPKGADREAIKKLALRATAKEGDLVVWAATTGAGTNKMLSAVGRATAIKRLAGKLARLRKNTFAIQVGPGEAAAHNRVLVALLEPEASAASADGTSGRDGARNRKTGAGATVEPGLPAAPLAPPPAAGPPSALPPVPALPVEPPPAAKPEPEARQPGPELRGDAGVPPPRVDTSVKADPRPEPNRDAGTGPADASPEVQPARVERLVPLPPALKEGAGGEGQLRQAINSFQPALKECADRALKRDPGLRGEARVVIDIRPSGRVKLAALHSKTLAGGWFEDCVRRSADAWRMPRTPQGYQVEIPLKLHVAGGDSP